MKNFKRILSSVLAVAIAATAIIAVSAAEEETKDPIQLDKDLIAATYIDFNKWEKDTNVTIETPGISPTETAGTAMYTNKQGTFQVKDTKGVAGTPGVVWDETLGDDADGDGMPETVNTWTSLKFVPAYNEDSSLNTNVTNYDKLGALGATDFYYYVDLSNYKKYRLHKDEEDDTIITGRDPIPKNAPWACWMGIWDSGTSVGESTAAYVIGNKMPYYIQTENGDGGNNWTELASKNEAAPTIPKDYKGYVRIPRTSMVTIWGANGDVIAEEGKDKVGDNLFNGPFEFISWNGNCGGYEFEGATKTIDNLGFISYEFDESIISTPVEELFVKVAPPAPITSTPEPITSDVPLTGAKLSVEVGDVVAGQEVTVKVSVPANTNIAAYSMDLTYDDTLLTFVKGTGGTLMGNGAVVNGKTEVKNLIKVAGSSATPSAEAGTILEVVFKVSDTFKAEDVAKLTLKVNELWDIDGEAIEFHVAQNDVKIIPVTSTPDPLTSTPDPLTSTPDPATSTPDPATSTPSTSNPNAGSTGVAGVASAFAITALATAAAIILKKKN